MNEPDARASIESENTKVTLNPAEIARLHVEDELGTDSDLQLLADAGIDVEMDRALRVILKSALTPAETPALADAVMARLGSLAVPVSEAVEADLGLTPTLSDEVMQRLGSAQSSSGWQTRGSHLPSPMISPASSVSPTHICASGQS